MLEFSTEEINGLPKDAALSVVYEENRVTIRLTTVAEAIAAGALQGPTIN